jgi:hypothetical protein
LARATQHAVARRATPAGTADTPNRRAAVAFQRSDRHGARRALIEDIREDKKGWAQHGIAALAVSLLGLGVAGSVALTGAAQPQHALDAQPKVEVSRQQGVPMPSAFERDASSGRDGARPALSREKITSRTDQRAEALTKRSTKQLRSRRCGPEKSL